MRIIILFLFFIFAVNAIASEQVESTQQSQQTASELKPEYKYMLFLGNESRMEENVQKDLVVNNYKNYSAGVGFGKYKFLLEKAQYSELTGNATLNVKRIFDDYLIWAHYASEYYHFLEAFVGAGLGTYKNTVETSLNGMTTTNSSNFKLLTGLCFGIGLSYKIVYTGIDVRLLFGDEMERQPTVASLLKIGLIF